MEMNELKIANVQLEKVFGLPYKNGAVPLSYWLNIRRPRDKGR